MTIFIKSKTKDVITLGFSERPSDRVGMIRREQLDVDKCEIHFLADVALLTNHLTTANIEDIFTIMDQM